MPDVSIIIVNYNEKDFLDKCIDSIKKATSNIPYETIVIDNASKDGSIEFIKNKYPQIKIIANNNNQGFVKACNQGISISSGRHIMLLNNDVIVKDKAIEKLYLFIDRDPKVAAVGPKLLNADGSIQYQCRRGFPNPTNSFFYLTGLSKLFPKSKKLNSYLMTYLKDDSIAEVDSLCGASMMIRKDVLDRIGLLDEDFFMYGEDIDLSYRIKSAGWQIYYLPEAEIMHYGGISSRKRSFRSLYEFYRAMLIFHRKHYSKKYFFALNWIVYAGIFIKFSISFIQNLFRRNKFVGTKKPA